MLNEHVEFLEAALVQELGYPFAGRIFAFLVLRLYSFFTAAKFGVGPALYQFLYVVLLN